MSGHSCPCPACGFGSRSYDGTSPVWKIYTETGVAVCLDCGFITDESYVRKHSPQPDRCFHSWPNTGMKISHCTYCGIKGEYNFYTGKYDELDAAKKY